PAADDRCRCDRGTREMLNWLNNLRRALATGKPKRRPARHRLTVEGLETRCLLATGITEHVVPLAAVEATGFNGTVATFTDANAGRKPIDFLATITWGDSSSTPGTVVADPNGG